MQHNPGIEEALIELRIDIANGICQAHHGCREKPNPFQRHGGWSWQLDRVEFYHIWCRDRERYVAGQIFNLENHLGHVVTNFLISTGDLTLKSAGSLVRQAEASGE